MGSLEISMGRRISLEGPPSPSSSSSLGSDMEQACVEAPRFVASFLLCRGGHRAMYQTANGEEIFVVDCHSHLWDASPENQKNKYGRGWIDCFYAYHKNLSPPEYVWPLEKYEKYSPDDMVFDQFVKGYVDLAILQPTYLTDFYKKGFNTIEQNSVMKKAHPDRYILNGAFDPRDGEAGLDYLRRQKGEWDIKGVKLYTAEWRGN